MERLNVFLLGNHAGVLESERGRMTYRYLPEYLARQDAVPLSHTMPLQDKTFDSQTTRTFFENILPPEVVRKKLGKILHLSRNNIFGFLKAIGGDCAGAVSLHAETTVVETGKPARMELSKEETARILSGLRKTPLNLGAAKGFRISGTGAQDKLIACVDGGKVFLPLFGEPSTHILKPPVPDYPDSVFNEFFCMKLAARVGIPVSECDILFFKGEPCYCVRRYDRTVDESGKVLRLHQEDFCQMLGVGQEEKYESEGGPSIRACFGLIREMQMGTVGQIDFIRRVVFNYLIGNGDAHGKNFSVLYRGRRAILAPSYDLLCTEVYKSLARTCAMSIGGEFSFDSITRKHFHRMAEECRIYPAAVLEEIDNLTGTIQSEASKLAEELNTTYPSPVYEKILSVIGRRIESLS